MYKQKINKITAFSMYDLYFLRDFKKAVWQNGIVLVPQSFIQFARNPLFESQCNIFFFLFIFLFFHQISSSLADSPLIIITLDDLNYPICISQAFLDHKTAVLIF